MSERRKVVYVTGTRADFGLMQSTLKAIHASSVLELGIVVTGMHLDERYGDTAKEIEDAGLPVVARVPVSHVQSQGADTARNIATMLSGFVNAFAEIVPDLVLILGDRGEMLAAAIAGGHMSIPVVHVHGGERSGTIDEPVRHAISKLSHIHLVATEESAERLVKMGETPETVHIIGAPGLDGLTELASYEKKALFAELGLEQGKQTALLLYHPVLQEADEAGEQVDAVIRSLLAENFAVLALKPNSDAGSAKVLGALERRSGQGDILLLTHLRRDQFVSLLKHVDVLIGNSSSGIIEAASFGTPVVNIGSRQHLRQRNRNVIDVAAEESAIARGLALAQQMGRLHPGNIYGDGNAGGRLVSILESLDLSGQLMNKFNAY
ncbi:UDP-N-acetylglucosamine 2-epimerase (hydrolyzing) [Devosia sp. BSSL-BM10]|uniref:UDP-N-acetylglucosamine 2-epimerase (Hydrolyzing) n=1 Tax=Devosia litorisediminis TaxID=2829817 RepID=A0A942I6S4_9HYPH|nr:UDP-N-acetylglucosamine 2-epimerase [Devosia litorisediminis]MBS3849802.1 UDP-N-acetylglucosamine 2-epimerase (hydrolyzing) [Devosia litorisediminis]